jgi:hypothetical protein
MLFKLMCQCSILSSRINMVKLLFVVIFNLKIMQHLFLLLIANFKCFILTFKFANVLQQWLISLLSSQELLNHFLNIWVASTSTHQLESLFSMCMFFHLAFHPLFEVARPDLLNVKLLFHLLLLLVLTLVLSFLSNQVLIKLSFITFLNSIFLVFNWKIQRVNTFRPFFLVSLKT